MSEVNFGLKFNYAKILKKYAEGLKSQKLFFFEPIDRESEAVYYIQKSAT